MSGDTSNPPALPASARRVGLWSGMVLVILCAVYATHVRLTALSAWQDDPQQYVAAGVPMMTTLDAYYALRLARLYAGGAFVPHGPVPARHYARPEQADPDDWYDQREPKALPLLSGTLAVASRFFGGDIDRTGLLLPPLLSSLFMIPLFLCCWRLGAPVAGLLSGLVATFCLEYLQRTGVGWVREDMLNLFFPWMISCLILAMRADQRRNTLLLLAIAAGATLYLFGRWYGKPGLALAYVLALAVHLALARVPWRRIVACVGLFVVFANPLQFAPALASLEDFGQRYLWPSKGPVSTGGSSLRFPDVWSTISEGRSLHWSDTLTQILGRADLAVIGLLAFAVFAVWRWRSMAALAPVILLGMLALVSSRRFIFYLAPFVGIGWGLIVSLVVGRALDRIGEQSWLARPATKTAIAYIAAIGLYAAWLAPSAAWHALPSPPAIPAPVFHDVQVLAKTLPANARLWTWWDLGFAITDATSFGIYHDGAAQYTPQTNLIAASMVNADPRVMHDVIAFVDREGNRGIRRLAATSAGFDDLLSQMRLEAPRLGETPIYVLYTPDMLEKYSAMRALGTSQPVVGARRGPGGIVGLRCDRIVNDVLHCAGATLDLRTGLVERTSPTGSPSPEIVRLRRGVIVQGGRVLRQQDYDETSDLTLEIVLGAGGVKAVFMLDEAAFRSNLNQMFVLGRFDAARFEEVLNDFPNARAFRVLAPGD